MAPDYGVDRLSHEIFALLETNFLFGDATKDIEKGQGNCRVRILSVDAGGATGGLLAALSLARLEAALRRRSGDPSASLPDFFDLAAGSGAGGLLVALLFTRKPDGSGLPLYSAADALRLLADRHRALPLGPGDAAGGTAKSKGSSGSGGGLLRGLLGRGRSKKAQQAPPHPSAESACSILLEVFGDLTLRDAAKPVLVPCYDLATGAPFVFSRADAAATDAYDFRVADVCAATLGATRKVESMDGATAIAAADGGVAVGNPAAVAVTHVLNNLAEFPSARGVEDLLVVSVGNGEAGAGAVPDLAAGNARGIARIAGDGVADMVDQAVAMAFGQSRESNYIRIQGRELESCALSSTGSDPAELLRAAEQMLAQRAVESVLFRGKRLSDRTNAHELDRAARELVKEGDQPTKPCCPMLMLPAPNGFDKQQGSPFQSSSSRSSAASLGSSPSPSSSSSP